jgi:DNA-directed RNA polymerase
MDASNISLVIKNISKIHNKINILSIHDCFGSNANNINILYYFIKIAFLSLYADNDFIESYHNFIINYIKLNQYDIINYKDKEIVTKFITDDMKKTKIVKIQVPKKPNFNKSNIDFVKNIMDSRYLFN